MRKVITFNCELCGSEKTEPFSWYSRREFHYCGIKCANIANGKKRSLGLSKKEYDKLYWGKPENVNRRKESQKVAYQKRMSELSDSYKKSMFSRCKIRARSKGTWPSRETQ